MSRKRPKEYQLEGWLSPAKNSYCRSYTRFDNDFLDHPAVNTLSRNAFYVLVALATHCAGHQTFSFPYTAAERLNISQSSYKVALRELQEAGFIEVHKGRAKGAFPTGNEIQWVFRWKDSEPPKKPRKPRGKPIVEVLNGETPQ